MKKKIKVAIVAPSFGQTGGPEIVVTNLVNALAKRKDIDITLFAPADWKIDSKHVATIPQSLWSMKGFKEQTEYFRRNLIMENIFKVTKYQKNFDIIHLHSYRYAYAVATLLEKPCLLTLHSKITEQEFEQMRKIGIKAVALSKAHKKNFKTVSIIGNGIDVESIKPSFTKGEYLITAGRLLENKGIDIAIKIAKKAKKKLLIFGRIGVGEDRQEYYHKKIKPFLDEDIIYMGEASQQKLFSYLKNAEAMLFPIRSNNLSMCPLIVMESLACGTPVIGTKVSPLEEIPGWEKVAFLSENVAEMTRAVGNIESFDRKKCREFAQKNYSNLHMAEKYAELYRKIMNKKA